jgi:hypothetical protein
MKRESVPQWLWHYTKIESGLNILSEKKLRFNNIGKTNDPRESRPWEIPTLRLLVQNDLEKDVNEANDVIRNDIPKVIRDEWKVACFTLDQISHTEQPSDLERMYSAFLNPGYARPRMWAQYAENHKGVCLSFDKEKLEDDLRHRFDDQYRSGEINYDREIFMGQSFSFPIGFAENILTDIKKYGPKDAAQKYVNDNYKSLFLVKNPDWASETEFRCLIHSVNNQVETVSIEKSVEEVIVGMDFPKIFEPSLIAFCKELKIPARRIKWFNGLTTPKELFETLYEPPKGVEIPRSQVAAERNTDHEH